MSIDCEFIIIVLMIENNSLKFTSENYKTMFFFLFI